MAMSGAEDLDLVGFQPNSQVPGAWMGAAYAFFNSIERDEKIKQKDSSKPAAECADVQLSSKRSTISRSRSRSRDKREIKKNKGEQVIDVESILMEDADSSETAKQLMSVQSQESLHGN